MSKRRKPWGHTETVYLDSRIQVERVVIVPGGHSSIHYHATKWNTFQVVEGELEIRQWTDSESAAANSNSTTTILVPTFEGLEVPPMVPHQFRAITPVIAYEIYRAATADTIDPNEIVRLSKNGVGRPNQLGSRPVCR